MKLFLISFTLLATTWAQSLSSEYLPPTEEYSGAFSNAVETNFLENEPTHSLADDGYRYKTVKRFRLRHRRDVSELSNSYLPPHAASAPAPSFSSAVESAPAPVFSTPVSTESYEVEASEPAPAHSFGDDGYRYKTVKRYRLRRRRDVSELSNSYLPPHAASAPAPVFSSAVETAPAPVYSAPVATESYEVEASEPAPAHSFGDDGYLTCLPMLPRQRKRRAPAPVFSSAVETAPAPVYSAPVATESYEVEASEPAPAHSFGDDGYRYKTVKRYRLRRRRDVSELSNSYLPPNAASAPAPAYSTPVETAPAPVYSAPAATESYEVQASEPAHSFGEDGYRYKTKFIIIGFAFAALACAQYAPSTEYLPPIQEVSQSLELDAPSNEYLTPVVGEETTLADDGYRYKTVRRHRQRRRRDVSELTQYLPPTQEASFQVAAPSNEYLSPVVEEQQTVLADDGYRYKTVRRQRKRRDVSELTQYLPPTQEASFEVTTPSNEYLAPAFEEQQTVLADDGYRYKTVRRQRKRRDVSELTQYLPPTQEASFEVTAPSNEYLSPVVEEQQTVLACDGYRYKTVRRQRKRRDVSELTQYLPPTQETSFEVTAPSNEYLSPVVEEQQTVLADDGYRYKTVRRQRKRRDVSELTQYLPPTQETSFEVAAPSTEYLSPVVEEQQTVLADDGYRYKTVRRQRKRRDVSELTQYLPPTQETSFEVAAPSNEYLAPTFEEQQTVLADDGYRYKTVRRQRKRRDVSELTQYLPPTQEVAFDVATPSNEYLAPAVEEQQTVLADDGYRYKTVRRQRKRRDVNELSQYLPPTQETSFEVASPSNEYLAPSVEEPQTVLADDGYRYKTVRRHRQRRRRDVIELTQYLPPTQEASFEVAAPSNEYLAPFEQQPTIFANDGYRYKTVKKFLLKFTAIKLHLNTYPNT
ncbi:hypothetical protein CVS40_7260 [Lucilia cuprina]|nr:hypothetical protein CVS40_7260 [Lucilia cuprina]